jgi:hypothetical protein
MGSGLDTAFRAIALCLIFCSCSKGDGDGRVSGSLVIPGCGVETDDYDMGVDFFEADYFENTLSIRLQRTGGDMRFADGVLLVIRDVEKTAEAGAGAVQEIRVEPSWESCVENGPDGGIPTTSADSPARASLYLNETCPDDFLAFSDGAGSFQMESIYIPDEQRRIQGSFSLKFIDPRYWESPDNPGPIAEIQGEFEFNYDGRKQARAFP